MRALLLLAALAGCLTPSLASVPASDAAEGPSVVMEGCENLSGSFPVLASDARAVLPAGFQPRTADVPTHAVFWIVSVRCAEARVDGASVGEAWMSYGELDVLPPGRLAVAGATDHTIPMFVLAQPEALVDGLRALGLPRVQLATTTSEALATGGERVTVASDEGGFDLLAQPTTDTGALGAGAWGMFGVEGRQVLATIRGASTSGEVTSAALAQTSDGALPLMSAARPVARGGAVSGFGLSFERLG